MKKLDLCGFPWSLIYVKNDVYKRDGETADIMLSEQEVIPRYLPLCRGISK